MKSNRDMSMAQPLSGIATGDVLKPIYAQKAKPDDEKTISASTKEALALKLEGEKADGWRVLKTNKRSFRLAKDKPADRQLEDEIWTLFYRMGFKELNTDRRFSIRTSDKTSARQLDVFAKDDDAVFIVECTHAKEAGAKSVKSLLDKIEAIREEVILAIHAHYGKSPKLKVKFAIATRNVEWRTADRNRAEASGIPIITDGDLRYFSKLTDLLKTAARYQFLGRYLKDERVEGLSAKVPATRGSMGGNVFYNFLISPYDLLKISYISHKSTSSNDDLETYQRMVKPSRLKAIGRFIDTGGKFPTNIVVNLKTDRKLRFDLKERFGDTATGILTLPGLYGSAWVIDGQHRLYGYPHATRSEETDKSVVPVLAYENIPVRDEIKLFIDINTQQVKVTRNLVNEILSSLNVDDPDPNKRLDALLARIALRLDLYPTSPVRDRILTVSQEKSHYRCLTLTSLVDGLSENNLVGAVHRSGKDGAAGIQPGPLGDPTNESTKTMEKAVATLSQYFGLFATRLEAHWRLGDAKGGFLCTNLGVRALLLLLRKIVTFIENKDGVRATVMDAEDIVEAVAPYVEPVIEYFRLADASDINAFRSRGSSLASVNQNWLHMGSIIHEMEPSFNLAEVMEHMSSRDIEGTKQAKEMIDDINRILFENVIRTLQAKYGIEREAWWIQGVPKAVRNSCDQMYNDSDGTRERWRYLFLANYSDIVTYGDNWDLFKDYYNFYGKGKKADLVRWIGRVNKSRTITHHAEKGPLSKEEVDYVRRVHQLVKAHIEAREKVDPAKKYLAETRDQESAVTAAAA